MNDKRTLKFVVYKDAFVFIPSILWNFWWVGFWVLHRCIENSLIIKYLSFPDQIFIWSIGIFGTAILVISLPFPCHIVSSLQQMALDKPCTIAVLDLPCPAGLFWFGEFLLFLFFWWKIWRIILKGLFVWRCPSKVVI